MSILVLTIATLVVLFGLFAVNVTQLIIVLGIKDVSVDCSRLPKGTTLQI